ncbi:hypothetical protein IWW45_003637 [Coemansia sp. RSA 485]|nr:hypothetical protein IWW45_003637 [Coemansia sp. RSA 485]
MPPRPLPQSPWPLDQQQQHRRLSDGPGSPPPNNIVSRTSSTNSDVAFYEVSFQHQRLPQHGYPYQQQPRLVNINPQNIHKPLPSPPSTTHMTDAPNNDVVNSLQLQSMRLHDSQESGKDAGWSHSAAGAGNIVSNSNMTDSQATHVMAMFPGANPGSEFGGPMAVPVVSGTASTASEGMLISHSGALQQPSLDGQSSDIADGSHGLPPGLDESVLTTYQYALRYAMLLDTDNLQLAARSRSVGAVGDVINRTSTRSSDSSNNGGSASFKVNSVSKATGAANLSNRTPTLVVHPGGRAGEFLAANSTDDIGANGGHAGGIGAKSRGWRSSLFEIGDSAARRLKAEINNAGKLKNLAKSKLGGGSGSIGGNNNGSSSSYLASAEPPSFRNPAASKDGRITPLIVKALMQQLKKSAGAVSLHQFTKDCYMDMFEELRSKGSGGSMYEYNTVHDLIDSFTEIAHSVCQRYNVIIKSDVSRTVDNQVSLFIKLFRTVLQSEAHTSREAGIALLKLDDYFDAATSDSRARSSSELSFKRDRQGMSDYQAVRDEEDRAKHQISSWLKDAFSVPDAAHRQIMAELRREVNQQTAIYDLRTCLLVLKKDISFSGKPDDFRNTHMYNVWKEREVTVLEQLIQSFSMRHRFMSGEQIAAGRLKLEASVVESMGDEEIAASFEYIPAQATLHYQTLVKIAVQHDIVGSYSPSDQPDDVKQLSISAKDLLKQLGIFWRMSKYYCDTCYLDAIYGYCEQGVLPETYLIDAFGKIERIVHLMNPLEWQISHFEYLHSVESKIEYSMLSAVCNVIEGLDHQKPDKNSHIKKILRALILNDANCPVMAKKPVPHIEGRRDETLSFIGQSIDFRCECLNQLCFGEDQLSLRPSIDGYARLAQSILADYDRCYSIFAEPILEDGDRRYDIAGMVAEIETEYFWTNLRRHIEQFGYSDENMDIEAGFELCRLIAKIELLHSQYSPRVLEGISSRQLFKETLDTWLRNIDSMKAKWFENALKLDSNPEELGIGKHSTSVIDLISCFSQLADMCRHLEWPDAEMKAYFLSQFMKYVGICFELYASIMLKEFLESTSVPVAEEPKSPKWNSMWNSRKYKERSLSISASTQTAISKLDQMQPVQVSSMACIKINNVSFALKSLHEMQDGLGVEETMQTLGGENRPSIKAPASGRLMMSFDVIRAEGLEIYKRQYDTSVDTSARPYVKLALTRLDGDNTFKRKTFATTRPAAPGTSNPRWNESFELPIASREELQLPLEVRICTREGPKTLGFREKTRARAYFAPPSSLEHSVDGSTDMVLDMEPSGHLLLHVTMDTERDDAEFYSGKMFRYLARTLADMQQQIVEQVSVGIREYLRLILVVQPNRYRTSNIIGTGIDRSIQFLKRNGHQAPGTVYVTQESCKEALIPLIDYLEDNLHTLFVCLYEDTANEVIGRVWNEVLTTLEDILLPPLRGSSKGHAKPLSEGYLNNIYECLHFLKWYFGGGDDKDGLSEEVLEGGKYAMMEFVGKMYFMTSRELMDAYMRELHQSVVDAADTGSGSRHRPPSVGPQLCKSDTAPCLPPPPPSYAENAGHGSGHELAHYPGTCSGKRPLPPVPLGPTLRPPQKHGVVDGGLSDTSDDGRRHHQRRFSGHDGMSANSSSESLATGLHDVRTAIVPSSSANQSGLGRSRSVWAHKNAATIRRLHRKNRMVSDKGDIILRILRLRFDKEAMAFVQTQLELRSQQMQFEMRRVANKTQAINKQ